MKLSVLSHVSLCSLCALSAVMPLRAQEKDEFFLPLDKRPPQARKTLNAADSQLVLRDLALMRAKYDSLNTIVSALQAQLFVQQHAGVPVSSTSLLDSLITSNESLRKSISYLEENLLKSQADNRQLAAKNAIYESSMIGASIDADRARNEPRPSTTKQLLSFIVQYDRALDLFKARQYTESLNLLETILAQSADEDLEVLCTYWKGENHFALGDFEKAREEFETVLAAGASSKQADAYFMLGRSYEQLNDIPNARQIFEKLVKEYPDDHTSAMARKRLASPRYRSAAKPSPLRKKSAMS